MFSPLMRWRTLGVDECYPRLSMELSRNRGYCSALLVRPDGALLVDPTDERQLGVRADRPRHGFVELEVGAGSSSFLHRNETFRAGDMRLMAVTTRPVSASAHPTHTTRPTL